MNLKKGESSMKIDNNIVKLENYLQNIDKSKKAKDKNEINNSATKKKKDSIQLSYEADKGKQVQDLLKQMPMEREDKIAEIKSRIENNTYNIKGEEVGERLLVESMLINKLV
ncbi:flagellar biosynthesis anti-sigma factor FlgM [Candidatus Desantisbacteria bacterium]|nr:flagellar biosynthesis anti-sigma factor FlgM [Candidatus Desantisbacteria bacterium]